jgi:signal transduction histidine kinase
MTPPETPAPQSGEPSHALGAGAEYSRDPNGNQREFSALCEAVERLAGGATTGEAIEAALARLAGPEGIGFARALWLEVDADRLALRGARVAGAVPAGAADALQRLAIPLEDGGAHPLVRALRDGGPRRLAELPGEDEFGPALRTCAGNGPFVLAPVAVDGRARGLLVLAGDGAAPAAGAAFLARALGREMERIEAGAERRRLTDRLGRLGEHARSALTATSLPDVLSATVRGAVRLVGGDAGLLWTWDEREGRLQLAVSVPGRVVAGLAEALPGGAAHAALPAVVLPLHAFGDVLGVLAVVGRAASDGGGPDRFAAEEESLLATLAGYAAVGLRNAQLAERVRGSERRQREMRAEFARVEKLAHLGELTTRLAHDLRNPAAAIRGFARRIDRALPKESPQREVARLIAREARRIEALLADPLQLARDARPRLALRSLNRIVQDAIVEAREEIQGHGVRLEEAYAEPMPELLLDAERVRLAVLNILRCVVGDARPEQALRVETLVQGERVLLEIAAAGEPPRGETVDRLFAPFGCTGQAGAGLGLSVAQQIVNEHGGEVSVRAEAEWRAIFTLSFPIQDNRERRRPGDRRGGRDRRRPAAGDPDR